ncbi:hypothetical protein TWF281_004077 [Arthrobotrys megalospora]
MAEIIGIVLAIPPLVDLSITHIDGVASKIHTYKNAQGLHKDDLELHDIHSGQLDVCLGFVKDAAPFLTENLNNLLHKTLLRLTKSLDNALVTLERGIDKDGSIRRVWYSTIGRLAVRRDLEEVEKCQLLFQRAVQFAALFGGSRISLLLTKGRLDNSNALARVQRLTEAIQGRLNDTGNTKMLLQPDEMPVGKRTRLPYSDIRLITSDESNVPLALVEYRQQITPDTRKVRDIARILNGTHPSMGIIRCQGFHPVLAEGRCELIFPLSPENGPPKTLRELLLSPDNDAGVRFSINSRIKLARQLATAVLFVHTAKLVHKNIRPENIVIIPTTTELRSELADETAELGDLYLTGFDFARKEDESSTRTGDSEWYKNIYKHPERQGLHPEVDFTMLHDIYSLGVVLLEIALWRSYVLPTGGLDGTLLPCGSGSGSRYRENKETGRFFDRKTKQLKHPQDILKGFIRKAETAIPPALGNRYRDTVLMCLKCIDGGFGDPSGLVDQDGVLVGLVYIERVLATLDDIVV